MIKKEYNYKLINIMSALNSIGKTHQYDLINELIIMAETKKEENVYDSLIKLYCLIETNIDLNNIIVDPKMPYRTRLKHFAQQNWTKVIPPTIILYIIIWIAEFYLGIELPSIIEKIVSMYNNN